MSKVRRTILALLLAIFAVSIAMVVWIDCSYYSNLPKAPDVETGRISKIIVMHGSVRYGTEQELHALETIHSIALPLGAMCFVIAFIWGFLSGDFQIRKSSSIK
jgi:hypothetical protein